MSSLKMQSCVRVALLLVVVGCVWAQPPKNCPEDPCTEDHDIGEPHSETAPSGGRKLLQSRGLAPTNTVPNLANTRSLLAPMCSETKNSPQAVKDCTDAVRMNPGAFSADYRCGSSWVNSYPALGPLRSDSKLNTAAQRHSEDNGRIATLTHTGSDGSSVSNRVERAGYSWGRVRENIAWGYTSAKDVVMGWMCSSGHRDNIMSCDISDIGVGIALGTDNRYYHTQVFACPRGGRCDCSGAGASSGGQPSVPAPQPTTPMTPMEPMTPSEPMPMPSPTPSQPSPQEPTGEPRGESPTDETQSPFYSFIKKFRKGGSQSTQGGSGRFGFGK